MKTFLVRIGLTAASALAFLVSAQAELTRNSYALRMPPNRVTASISVTPPKQLDPVPIPPGAALASTTTSTEQWVDLKDYTFAQRDALLAGLAGMVTRVDAQIEELKTKRAAMTASTRTADWDFAMKEMHNARANLKFACDELGKATAETWSQQRERVGQAWERTQSAYSAVKSSTTM
jgi:hypothetical protein